MIRPSKTDAFVFLFVVANIIVMMRFVSEESSSISPQISQTPAFRYTFDVDGELHETGAMEESSSPYWWLNSGGIMTLENGSGRTLQGTLASGSDWQMQYAKTNPRDTDKGTRPQNIFRLLTRSTWRNTSTSVVYTIRAYNQSNSPERYEPNGILLMNRYKDADNLYYAGLRVDGTAVIKKKRAGAYYTLAQETIITGNYDRGSNPNLLPTDTPIALKTDIQNKNGIVVITLYADIGATGKWKRVAEAFDDGSVGGDAIFHEGHAGLRTDFMDVEFDHFTIELL